MAKKMRHRKHFQEKRLAMAHGKGYNAAPRFRPVVHRRPVNHRCRGLEEPWQHINQNNIQ